MDRASTEIYTLSLHDALPIYGLGSIQSLNLRLLINAENHGLIRRMQVQADNIADLFNEERIGRELEMALPLGLEPERLPNAMHRRGRKAGMLGHGGHRPMGTIVRLGGQPPTAQVGQLVVW